MFLNNLWMWVGRDERQKESLVLLVWIGIERAQECAALSTQKSSEEGGLGGLGRQRNRRSQEHMQITQLNESAMTYLCPRGSGAGATAHACEARYKAH